MLNVVVTGGSRGLGLAIVRRLAAANYRVVAIARTMTAELDAAVRTAKEAARGSIAFVSFDLSAIESIPQLAYRLRSEFGPIYGLVNNAGLGTSALLAIMPNAQIESLIRLNTLSPIMLTKYVARAMMADGNGRIVNIASIVGSTGFNGLSVYGATKAALIGFTRSLAREVGQVGITVNAVAPGFIATEMTRDLSGEDRDKIARRSALRRLAEVDDVAGAVEFLLGDGGKNISGTVLTIDAGGTA